MSVIEMVDAAADLWEEQRLFDSMDESYEKYGDEIREEMKDWIDLPVRPPDAD
jgi:hypothetical protein